LREVLFSSEVLGWESCGWSWAILQPRSAGSVATAIFVQVVIRQFGHWPLLSDFNVMLVHNYMPSDVL
jgi:hypothetical protein